MNDVRTNSDETKQCGQGATAMPNGQVEFSREFVEAAARLIAFDERHPTSTLQRKLRMGYNTAGRLYKLILTRRQEMSHDYRSVLDTAWELAIKHYEEGRVNSECTLQAYLYAQLNAALPDCIVLCEPKLSIDRHGNFYPDIVVIEDKNRVVAIIEIKFVPHHYPVFEDDIAKIRVMGVEGSGSAHDLLLDPKTGTFADGKVTISGDCLLSFAVIGRHDAAAVHPATLIDALCVGGHEKLKDRFLPLTYETNRPNSPP